MVRSLAAAATAAAAAGALALLAGAAGAQEAIPTAAGAPPPPATADEPPPPPLPAPSASRFAPVRPGPCGTAPIPPMAPKAADGSPAVDHSPHGELTVGVGNHGMRYAEGSVCVPVGDSGFVALDVGQGRMDGWRR